MHRQIPQMTNRAKRPCSSSTPLASPNALDLRRSAQPAPPHMPARTAPLHTPARPASLHARARSAPLHAPARSAPLRTPARPAPPPRRPAAPHHRKQLPHDCLPTHPMYLIHLYLAMLTTSFYIYLPVFFSFSMHFQASPLIPNACLFQ
jgi:hypothetical protein